LEGLVDIGLAGLTGVRCWSSLSSDRWTPRDGGVGGRHWAMGATAAGAAAGGDEGGDCAGLAAAEVVGISRGATAVARVVGDCTRWMLGAAAALERLLT
jgi:hypothetical protein